MAEFGAFPRACIDEVTCNNLLHHLKMCLRWMWRNNENQMRDLRRYKVKSRVQGPDVNNSNVFPVFSVGFFFCKHFNQNHSFQQISSSRRINYWTTPPFTKRSDVSTFFDAHKLESRTKKNARKIKKIALLFQGDGEHFLGITTCEDNAEKTFSFWCFQQNRLLCMQFIIHWQFSFCALFLLKCHRLVSTFPVARLIWKMLLIVSSCSRNLTGHFASGGVLTLRHIISCFVWVTLALNGEAAPAAAVIRKVFISKWCVLKRNKPHITIRAQLIEAESFLCRFSLGFFSVCRFFSKDARVIT